MRRIPKPAHVLIWTLAGLVSAYAALNVALTLLLPPPQLAEWVTPRLEAALGREAEVGGVRLRAFPRIAIRVDRLALENPSGFSDRPLLRLGALDLRPRILPLLRRTIVVDEIRLTRPRLLVESNASGDLNLKAVSNRPKREAAPRRENPAAFVVRRLVVSDGIVLYDDARTGRAVRVGDLDAELSLHGDLSGSERFEARVHADLARMEARIPGWSDTVVTLPPLSLDLDAAAQLDPDSADVRQVVVRWGEVAVVGRGGVTRFRSPEREIALSLEASNVDAAKLWASLPLPERLRGWRAAGTFDLELAAQGGAGEGRLPPVVGRLAVRDAGLATPDGRNVISGLAGEIRLEGQAARAEQIRARVLGRPSALSFTLLDFLDPVLEARWKGEIALDEMAKLGSAKDRKMRGLVSADLHVTGKPREPATLRVSGPVTLTNVTVEGPTPAVPVRIGGATLRFAGQGLHSDGLALVLGKSDLTLSFDAKDLIPVALAKGAKPPRPASVTFSARSRRFDWTELFPGRPGKIGYTQLMWARLAKRPVDGKSVEEVAREHRFALEAAPLMNAQGRVAIDTFVSEDLRATDVALNLTLRDGLLRLSNLRASVYGGRAQAELTVDLRSGPPYPLEWTFAADSVQAGALLDRFTLLRNAVTGALTFRLGGRTRLDSYLLPLSDDLAGDGRGILVNGALRNWSVTNGLANFLKNDRLKEVRVDRWVGTLEIMGSQVRFRDWNLAGERLGASIAGAFGFDGMLDAALRLQIDSSLARQLGGPAATALLSQQGSSWLALRVTGPATGPSFGLDTEAMREMAAEAVQKKLTGETEQARQEVEGKLREEAGRRLQQLFGGGRDTARTDTTRQDTTTP